jgi:Uma2 family endonuclease
MALDVEIARRRFTVDEYHRMGEAGILTEQDRVELIRGEVVQMSLIGSRHAGCVAALTHTLVTALGSRAILWPQNPVTLPPDSEPQPDIVLLRPRPDFYRASHPRAIDVLLMIEVADTTLRYDRRVKLPLYAEEGIAEVWIVNLQEECIEIYRGPTREGYRRAERHERGHIVSPEAFSDLVLPVDTILG